MLPITSLEVIRELELLAKESEDMSSVQFLTSPQRTCSEICAPYWKLNYPFVPFNKKITKQLFIWAQSRQVYKWMDALQKGEKIAFTGSYAQAQRIGHTLCRNQNPSLLSLDAQLIAKSAQNELKRMESFFAKTESQILLIIGIGGSSMGPYALDRALQRYYSSSKEVIFLSTLDQQVRAEVLERCRTKRVSIAVISKSGGTFEVAENYRWFKECERELQVDATICISTKDSPLDKQKNFDQIFYMDKCVGGRFSVSSVVGALPIIFRFGKSVFDAFLQGCYEMDLHALVDERWENLPLALALIRLYHCAFQRQQALCLCPYIPHLDQFILHHQQVEMESNGKSVDKMGRELNFVSGPLIWGATGPESQHSFFQWLHQAQDKCPVEFIIEYDRSKPQNKASVAQVFAQSIALAKGKASSNLNTHFEGNRSSWILTTEKLHAHSIGALFALYEHTCAFEGFLLGINSFDQEGVELGKDVMKRVLDKFDTIDDPSLVLSTLLEESALEE